MPIAYPYKFSDWYDYDKDCVNTTPFNVGTSSGSAGAMCTQQSPGANTYYHSGSTTYPSVNDIIYTDAAATTPLNGGSGLNWPYFAAGVAPGTSPVGYFRITGSTGAVQSISSCP
jgi:hypothetical protein|tara:strand:- start:50 stop:394 length:345 start_codon:yes stop_codon:yes gene_type:complete